MSRAFTGGSFLAVDTTFITDEPLTIFAWFKRTGTANTQTLAMIGQKDATGGNHSWSLGIDNSDRVFARTESTSGANSVSAGVGNDTASWHSSIAIIGGNASRFGGLDGTLGTEQTSSVTVTSANVNCLRLGKSTETGSVEVLEALAAHIAIWNVALSGTDFTNLHAGDNPLTIQAANLKAYFPFVTSSIADTSGTGLVLTDSSTSFNADNPTVDAPPVGGSLALRRKQAAVLNSFNPFGPRFF